MDASLIQANANRQRSLPGTEWSAEDRAEPAPRAVREYLATLDEAAWGAATEVQPKFGPPERGGMRSECQAALRLVSASMLARASAGVR